MSVNSVGSNSHSLLPWVSTKPLITTSEWAGIRTTSLTTTIPCPLGLFEVGPIKFSPSLWVFNPLVRLLFAVSIILPSFRRRSNPNTPSPLICNFATKNLCLTVFLFILQHTSCTPTIFSSFPVIPRACNSGLEIPTPTEIGAPVSIKSLSFHTPTSISANMPG